MVKHIKNHLQKNESGFKAIQTELIILLKSDIPKLGKSFLLRDV